MSSLKGHLKSAPLAPLEVKTGPKARAGQKLHLVDLMSYTPTQALAQPSSAFGIPRWDRLEPSGFYARYGKPVMPIILMLLALPAALLVMVPIALINWIAVGDRRLIFFRQERVGQHGRVFHIYKFRTMRPVEATGDFEAWGKGDTNRVTRVGKFLRSTHLDEVPQIFNILKGEMDFIGPRPEMVEIHEWACQEVPGFERRLVLRPGITGLSQITQGYTGQCREAYAEKLEGDDKYRENLSLRLDVAIVMRTFVWMARGRGWQWNKKK